MRDYIPNPEGRIPNPLRMKYQKKFGLSNARMRKISDKFLEQLDRCSDDAARRILLRISR